jgi:hypothetical protein
VFNDLGGGGELTEVMTDHFREDGDGKELAAVVDSKAGVNHFGEDNEVAAVGADDGFVVDILGFDLANFFEEADVAGREAAEEGAALAGGEEANELIHGKLLELIGGQAAIRELSARHSTSQKRYPGGY